MSSTYRIRRRFAVREPNRLKMAPVQELLDRVAPGPRLVPFRDPHCNPLHVLRDAADEAKAAPVAAVVLDVPDEWREMRYLKDAVVRVVPVGGVVVMVGGNSNGMGKSRGFNLDEILMVHHGGKRRDTLVTVETRPPEHTLRIQNNVPTLGGLHACDACALTYTGDTCPQCAT